MALISTPRLIDFCRRLGTSLRAGIDIRRAWEQETRRGSPKDREVMQTIHGRIAQGESMADAMRDSGYFPPLVLAMARVGEQTGKADEVLFRLADHYEESQRLTRNFMFGIAWPMAQLFVGLVVIGLVIWLPSAISGGENTVDILGFGLVGTPGLIIYAALVFLVLGTIGTFIYALVMGWFGPWPVLLTRRIPLVGRCWECLALARGCWALALAHEAGMTARQSAKLALAATHHPVYGRQGGTIDGVLAANRPFHEAFREAEGFPIDFLDAVETAELTGTITETMTRKSHDYQEEATRLLRTFAWVMGAAVMVLVGLLLVTMIFRLAFFYINTLNSFIDNPLGNP